MNYYFRSQNKSNTGGMIAIRKPKKSVKWADYNLEKPLQQIRLIDIVGKGKKLPNRNTNNIVTNNLQNNKPKDWGKRDEVQRPIIRRRCINQNSNQIN